MFVKGWGEKALNCRVCEREAVDRGFCSLHFEAYENLVDSYQLWSKASGILWKEYLSKIAEHSLTGDWVKGVANCLIKNGET
jgi:hypothetical protein